MPFIYSQRVLGMEAEEFLVLVVHNINKKIIILNNNFPTIKMKKLEDACQEDTVGQNY